MGRVNIKFNPAYKKAHDTKARYRILMGGAGSGKSHFVSQELLINMLVNREYQYLVVRKTGKSLRQSVFRLLTTLISEYDLKRYFIINNSDLSLHCVNGSRLIMSGLDDVEKLKSIAGINRIWVEEASEITENDLNQLDLRMRGINKIGYQMTLTFNPISELHWLKKVFFDIGRDNSYIQKTTYKDNKYLDEEYIRRLENLQHEDYQFYRIYTLGEWGSLGNVIFTNWDKADLTETSKTFDNFYNGIDFGFAEDPFCFIRVHYDKTNKTVYVLEEIYQRELHNDKASDIIKSLIGNEIVTCDSAEPKSIAEIKRYGVNAKGAKKGKDSIMHGIKWLQSQRIIVDEKCTNFIKEISGYKWKEDKDGNIIPKPVEYNDHLIDAIRYALENIMLETNTQWGWK